MSRFSQRTAWELLEDAFTTELRALRVKSAPLSDLTVSNPTVCGFLYDVEATLTPLKNRQAMVYGAESRGMLSAREAIAQYYREHEAEASPESFHVTTSTSEAYSFLFRLLCDAGDEVLIAQPSYPLFDLLADLDDVRLRPYPLFYDEGWWIDFAELVDRISPSTRAIVVVHPNNPTGHVTSRRERERLEAICREHDLALIVDEVFLDFPLDAEQARSFATGPHPVLTFVLSGISKIAALPQMKVAWLAVFGPDAERSKAGARLDVIADTFLSMNAPAQLALPIWLAARHALQSQIRERTWLNLQALRTAGLGTLRTDAGWSAVLRLPQRFGEDSAFELLRRGVVTHPGSFYGMAAHGRVVVSLLPEPAIFAEGVRCLREFVEEQIGMADQT